MLHTSLIAFAPLMRLDRAIEVCTRCRLSETRKRVVPGEGPVPSDLFFIGEAPGRNEDLSGRPFVGRAGTVLENLLSSVDISRDSVYITSIVKCRPPGNRLPKKDEVGACAEYLKQQIEILSPRIIVPMGSLASCQVFRHFGLPPEPIGRIHGRVFQPETPAEQLRLLPVYHPAALVHNPRLKSVIFNDFSVIPRLLNRQGG